MQDPVACCNSLFCFFYHRAQGFGVPLPFPSLPEMGSALPFGMVVFYMLG